MYHRALSLSFSVLGVLMLLGAGAARAQEIRNCGVETENASWVNRGTATAATSDTRGGCGLGLTAAPEAAALLAPHLNAAAGMATPSAGTLSGVGLTVGGLGNTLLTSQLAAPLGGQALSGLTATQAGQAAVNAGLLAPGDGIGGVATSWSVRVGTGEVNEAEP